jgi:hypothetical protein
MGKRKRFARSEVLTVATKEKQGVQGRTDLLLSFHYKSGVGLETDRIEISVSNTFSVYRTIA